MHPIIPDTPTCLALMDQYGMLDNIRQHSLVVAQVADTLRHYLTSPTEDTEAADPELVRAGALLHDIAKTRCLDGSCRHAEEGQKICEAHGYQEIGMIVREHVILSSFPRASFRRGCFSAKVIVYYADKRVRHDRIVSLQDRLAYIIERYSADNPNIEGRIRDNFRRCLELEHYLFSFIPFAPHELREHLLPLPTGGVTVDSYNG